MKFRLQNLLFLYPMYQSFCCAISNHELAPLYKNAQWPWKIDFNNKTYVMVWKLWDAPKTTDCSIMQMLQKQFGMTSLSQIAPWLMNSTSVATSMSISSSISAPLPPPPRPLPPLPPVVLISSWHPFLRSPHFHQLLYLPYLHFMPQKFLPHPPLIPLLPPWWDEMLCRWLHHQTAL